jgi:hypothetical protein
LPKQTPLGGPVSGDLDRPPMRPIFYGNCSTMPTPPNIGGTPPHQLPIPPFNAFSVYLLWRKTRLISSGDVPTPSAFGPGSFICSTPGQAPRGHHRFNMHYLGKRYHHHIDDYSTGGIFCRVLCSGNFGYTEIASHFRAMKLVELKYPSPQV